MHRYDEEYLGTSIPPWAQRLFGVVLMIATLSAAWYVLPALTNHHLFDTNPGADWFGVVILAALPFAVILAARLMGGKLEKREVFPPMALVVAGVILAIGGVFMLLAAWRDHESTLHDGVGLLLLGSWAIRFGMTRCKRATPAH